MGFFGPRSFAGFQGFNSPPGATLLFADSFVGPSLDTSKWISTMYWGSSPPRNPGTGEIQSYDPSAISVSNGLTITATKTPGAPAANGPKTGTSAADIGGAAPWVNPTNAQASDNVYATFTATSTGNSNYFYMTGFDFSAIASNAVITGVLIEWECKATAASTFAIPESYLVTAPATAISNSFTSSSTLISTTEGFVSGGSSTSLNNAALTPAIVKANGFGVTFNFGKIAGATSQTASLDSVRMTIYTDTSTYTSGIINTYGKFSHKYGYIEASCKIPGGGNGHWPAFWFANADDPTVWPPELDVAEWGWNNDKVNLNVHWNNGGTPAQDSTLIDKTPTDLSAAFHTYAVDWQPTYIRWYIDGVQVKEVTTVAEIPTNNLYLILNYAIGNPNWNLINMPDASSIFPGQYQVQYVKWWDRKP
jgi:beta-glucanase (GH16 family)